jgi:6-pyruvoyltetrahydropterin/6-carboxytetrahydropterin synthase
MYNDQTPAMYVTKEVLCDSAHHLEGYDGKCKQVHGHTYHIKVTVRGTIDPKTNMVVDFSFLKTVMEKYIVNRYDHNDLNEVGAALEKEYAEMASTQKSNTLTRSVYEHIASLYNIFKNRPTAELMAVIIFDTISEHVETGNASLHKVTVFETPTSYVEYLGELDYTGDSEHIRTSGHISPSDSACYNCHQIPKGEIYEQ